MGWAGDVSARARSYRHTMTTAIITDRATVESLAAAFHVCEGVDGRITAVTTYCNGGWDAELCARHAAEAPMLRP